MPVLSKTRRTLSKQEIIGILKSRKIEGVEKVARKFGVSSRAIMYHQRKHNAYKPEEIDRAIELLEEPLSEYPRRRHNLQEQCEHKNFTLFLKCSCTLILSENHLDQVIEILQREKARRGVVREIKI